MKKDPLSNKAPEKPMHEVAGGNSLLSSETILRTNKRGERRRRRCQVAFSYLPQNDDELELKVGDIIEVVGEVEEGWWEGVLNGKTGMFPSNFIKELSGESDELGISQDEQLSKSSACQPSCHGKTVSWVTHVAVPPYTSKVSLIIECLCVLLQTQPTWQIALLLVGREILQKDLMIQGHSGKTTFEGTILYRAAPGKTEGHRRYYSLRETTGSESDGGDSSSTKSEGANGTVATAAIQPKKVKGVGFGDIFKDKPIKLRPRSIEVENDFLPVEKTIGKKLPPTTATPDSSKTEMDSRTKTKDYCKVIFPYEAQNDDELTIKEGDIVTLINKDCIDVGWWVGELNGRRGVFPDNFVKLLPPDFEKEGNRPKKPPPPSAPVIKQGAGTTERKHEIKKIPPERPETLPNRTEEKERPEREPKLDLQKPSVPAIPPKKPRPPKTNSLNRPGALPPRRPERPVGPLTHTRSECKVEGAMWAQAWQMKIRHLASARSEGFYLGFTRARPAALQTGIAVDLHMLVIGPLDSHDDLSKGHFGGMVSPKATTSEERGESGSRPSGYGIVVGFASQGQMARYVITAERLGSQRTHLPPASA
ncbi:SH3 domain-containing kinase-binding protein 1 [Tupaia chinensis]|uniref:SH3 domain-containing kinase-binding protein 1 n=1 Tax=Tupaia chinensis TaxID=246437 RepID=L9JDQ1_TUPCH|nr:SH3 domain-containing kinase-binding protein 1 [Tupaia chinensis]